MLRKECQPAPVCALVHCLTGLPDPIHAASMAIRTTAPDERHPVAAHSHGRTDGAPNHPAGWDELSSWDLVNYYFPQPLGHTGFSYAWHVDVKNDRNSPYVT